jgi:thiamine-monophosphate kinase
VTSEFAAIARILTTLPRPPDSTQVWIGDDAAVLPAPSSGQVLWAADTVVAGVHADLALTGLADFGWKAMAASLSDLAAMGAEPAHSLVTVAGPAGTDLDSLYRGLAAASREYGCPIVGGDLTSAGVLVVTVAVSGTCDGEPVLRSGASPGDLIWVSGALGAAAAGLRHLRARATCAEAPEATPEVDFDLLVRAHSRPAAAIGSGRAARLGGATAMIDISDGLAADLSHVAVASGVGIRLEYVPVALGATFEEAMGGGDDYALAFCAPESAPIEEAFHGLELPIRIGTCTSDPAERTIAGGRFVTTGWEHRL